MQLNKSAFIDSLVDKLTSSNSSLEAYQKLSRLPIGSQIRNKIGWRRELDSNSIEFLLKDCGESTVQFTKVFGRSRPLEISRTIEDGNTYHWISYPCSNTVSTGDFPAPDGGSSNRCRVLVTKENLPSNSWQGNQIGVVMHNTLIQAYQEWIEALTALRRDKLKAMRDTFTADDIESFKQSKEMKRDNGVVAMLLAVKNVRDTLDAFQSALTNKESYERISGVRYKVDNSYQELNRLFCKNESSLRATFKVPAAKSLAKKLAKDAERAAKAAIKTPKKKKA